MADFNRHILALREEAKRSQEMLKGFKNKEEYDEALAKANEYLNIAKEKFLILAKEAVNILRVPLVYDLDKPKDDESKKEYPGPHLFLRDLSINEGISFHYQQGKEDTLSYLNFDIIQFESDYSILSLLQQKEAVNLGEEEQKYIAQESEYSRYISEGYTEDIALKINYLYNSIFNSKSIPENQKDMYYHALTNAAYRNGLSESIVVNIDHVHDAQEIIFEGMPTFGEYLDLDDYTMQKIGNFMEIAHNDCKGKVKNFGTKN